MKRSVKTSLPTLQDVQYVTAIYQRLAGNFEAETLTNLLEWQEQNIRYWKERYWVSNVLIIFLVSLVVVFLVILFSVINVPYLTLIARKTLLAFGLISIIIGIFLAGFVCFMLPYNYYSYIAREREITRKEKFKKLAKFVWHTIKPNLSLAEILDYHLAVCRDYAKLTAALLLNKYPEVYFLTLPNHVATAVRINGKYYVLDQRLPIMSLDSWIENWEWLLWWERIKNKLLLRKYIPKCNMYSVQFERNSNRVISTKPTIKEMKPQQNKNIEICIEKLEALLTREFNLNQAETTHREPDFKIILKNYVIYCEDDEIILYSMARSIKNRIEAELCGNIKKLSWFKISKKDSKNLVAEIYLTK
ncbi:transglutaminase-like domain-containing protein [Thermococcus paralvinellae]|uniref:Transglutaminase-like domain-containing protein n=1 Tax=Thermococcus paralvinellae TaxID=582419 RepID=W0I2H2_9EURY|nr:transglutaminase-like domain-containing protein [Thermococcus paralvinellae]AHF80224.1 hypothetical protein containing transglutaminase-like domain [Thermococcus paralvinellae]